MTRDRLVSCRPSLDRVPFMKLPVQIVFRDLVPLPSLESEIRQHVEKLEQFAPALISCHVTVESTANRRHQGHRYQVRIDLRVPDEEIFVGEHQADEDIVVAMRNSFDAMRRKLQDYSRRRRGQVKQHAELLPRQTKGL